MRYGIVSLIAILVGAASAAAEPPIVWMVPPLSRVGMDDAPGAAGAITIHAAKGESESFQICVRAPASGLSGVNVTATDFVSGDNRIAQSNVVLYREQYIEITADSASSSDAPNAPLGPGWYPDPLIPFRDPESGATLAAVPFSLTAGKNQPIWVDVNVPRTAAAGTYAATFTISSDQGSATVTASLVVWNFELPLRPALKTIFLMENGTVRLQKELLRNRLMPMRVNPADAMDECDLIDDFGLNTATVPLLDSMKLTTQDAPGVSDFVQEARRHNQLLPLYWYLADEIGGRTELYPRLKAWALTMHQAGIRNLVTMPPVPELYDDGSGTCWSAVDTWVLLPVQYDASADRCRYVQQKGDEVWSYNALVQDNYSPKWHIDFAPIDFRIQPGFISQSLGLTGLLYWRVDFWNGRPDEGVWIDGKRQPFDANDKVYPGDGIMVYPGGPVGMAGGVAPSMRLKWLRDGVDDFDYVDLLKAAGRGDWALQVSRSVGASWSAWTRDPAALEAARVQLGDALSGQ